MKWYSMARCVRTDTCKNWRTNRCKMHQSAGITARLAGTRLTIKPCCICSCIVPGTSWGSAEHDPCALSTTFVSKNQGHPTCIQTFVWVGYQKGILDNLSRVIDLMYCFQQPCTKIENLSVLIGSSSSSRLWKSFSGGFGASFGAWGSLLNWVTAHPKNWGLDH